MFGVLQWTLNNATARCCRMGMPSRAELKPRGPNCHIALPLSVGGISLIDGSRHRTLVEELAPNRTLDHDDTDDRLDAVRPCDLFSAGQHGPQRRPRKPWRRERVRPTTV